MTNKPKILLIEDDPADVKLALAVLNKMHMIDTTFVVSNGEDAIDVLQYRGRFSQTVSVPPLLILLDLKMPRVDGFEVLQRIKADFRLKSIPVVALTSSSEERDIERAYDLGVNGYVVKSIDFTAYRTALRAVTLYWGRINRAPGWLE
jgi:two-component system response regulator